MTIEIERAKRMDPPSIYGMCADGYTKRSGAPTSLMVQLKGETIWRRLMVWQFSNAGTLFVRIKGECVTVHEHQIPEPEDDK
jgi:aminoglycoside phosphotransferase (APT) family kinase protein